MHSDIIEVVTFAGHQNTLSCKRSAAILAIQYYRTYCRMLPSLLVACLHVPVGHSDFGTALQHPSLQVVFTAQWCLSDSRSATFWGNSHRDGGGESLLANQYLAKSLDLFQQDHFSPGVWTSGRRRWVLQWTDLWWSWTSSWSASLV